MTEVQFRASETLSENDLISDSEFEGLSAYPGETAPSSSDSVNNIVDPKPENELEINGAIWEFDSIDDTPEGAVENSFDNILTDVQFRASETLSSNDLISDSEFAALSAYSGETAPNFSGSVDNIYVADNNIDSIDDFGDLEKMLADTNDNVSASANNVSIGKQRPVSRRTARFEQLMKVSVKHLDDMSNLVGELVVNRNTLEQDQERLRQSLDNLLIQIHHLSDVGARMQELYERSLLEASLLATRKSGLSLFQTTTISNKDSERGFSELEMDRFTPFHTLSQEMIELIVRVRESASDIDFVTEETERVARQFRQVTTQLQEGLTKARMVAFSQVTDRVKRGVRDNAIKCGKQVELLIEGQVKLICGNNLETTC